VLRPRRQPLDEQVVQGRSVGVEEPFGTLLVAPGKLVVVNSPIPC
jgi:hypothetical protein